MAEMITPSSVCIIIVLVLGGVKEGEVAERGEG